MSVHLTYFVHGTTTDNEKNISSGRKDIELSEKGIQQSKELRDQIEDKSFACIFCSDLQRAIISAKITFEPHQIPIIIDNRLRECNYGDFNGEHSDIVEPLQEQNITTPFPNWESYEDVKKRIEEFINFLKTNYDGKHIAIVAHKAPQLALDVIVKWISREEAFTNDRRKTKSRKPWRNYIV